MISRPKNSPPLGGGQGIAFFPQVTDPRGLLRPVPSEDDQFSITFPARRIPPKRRSISGSVPFQVLGRNVRFESTLERDFLLILRQGSIGIAVLEQPITLRLKGLGFGKGRYTPDYIIWTWDAFGLRDVTLVEIKLEEDLREEFQNLKSKFIAGIRFARRQGWRFRLITDRHLRMPISPAAPWPQIHTPMRQLKSIEALLMRLFPRGLS